VTWVLVLIGEGRTLAIPGYLDRGEAEAAGAFACDWKNYDAGSASYFFEKFAVVPGPALPRPPGFTFPRL